MAFNTRSSGFSFHSRALSHSFPLYSKSLCGTLGGDNEGSLKLCMLSSQKLVPVKIMTHQIPIIGSGVFKGEGENGRTPRKNTSTRYVVQMSPTYHVSSLEWNMVLSVTPYFRMDDSLEILETWSSWVFFCSIALVLPLFFLFLIDLHASFCKWILGKFVELDLWVEYLFGKTI